MFPNSNNCEGTYVIIGTRYLNYRFYLVSGNTPSPTKVEQTANWSKFQYQSSITRRWSAGTLDKLFHGNDRRYVHVAVGCWLYRRQSGRGRSRHRSIVRRTRFLFPRNFLPTSATNHEAYELLSIADIWPIGLIAFVYNLSNHDRPNSWYSPVTVRIV